MDHVLWMIENHPEWDGFLLNLSPPGYEDERGAYNDVRAAWLRQVTNGHQSATVLHHAAVFFERSDPDFAVQLVQRAIHLEPEVPFHVEALGMLYGRSQFGSGKGSSFAIQAKATLLSSTDCLIVAGALNAIRQYREIDVRKLLLARLGELTGNRNPDDLLKELPSQSARYRDHQCDFVPLLRRCVDTLAP